MGELVSNPKAVAEAIDELNSKIEKQESFVTKTEIKTFSDSTPQTYTLNLTQDTLVTVNAYRQAAVVIYANLNTANEAVVCSATALNITQFSCGNSVFLKAGSYYVYYVGIDSNSSGKVITWS